MPITGFHKALQWRWLLALGIFLIPSTPGPGRPPFERSHLPSAAAGLSQSRRMSHPGTAPAEAAVCVACLWTPVGVRCSSSCSCPHGHIWKVCSLLMSYQDNFRWKKLMPLIHPCHSKASWLQTCSGCIPKVPQSPGMCRVKMLFLSTVLELTM